MDEDRFLAAVFDRLLAALIRGNGACAVTVRKLAKQACADLEIPYDHRQHNKPVDELIYGLPFAEHWRNGYVRGNVENPVGARVYCLDIREGATA